MGFRRAAKVSQGIKDFDKYYIDISIVDKITSVGEGQYSIEKVVVEEKRDIAKTIAVDADSVGVYNIINMVAKTGDMSLLPVDKGECNVDLVGAPTTPTEIKDLGNKAVDGFNHLPSELTQGMDMASFVNNMSQEKFDAFVKALTDRQAGSGAGKEEKNE